LNRTMPHNCLQRVEGEYADVRSPRDVEFNHHLI
jgi:hypothetical protein